jgi:hypothetical protein
MERNGAISRLFERDPIPDALETDWPVGAAGFEPLHLRIGIRSDSQPRWRNSNLRIWESDPLHSFRKSAHFTPFVWSPETFANKVRNPTTFKWRCRRSNPAAPTGESVSNAYGIFGAGPATSDKLDNPAAVASSPSTK